MQAESLPFVSFCISCYKQEKLIAETLQGAFAQTYGNMEIVISDDCSPDGTVDAIKREIAEYQKRPGPKHKIVLNVNKTNLGNLGNWSKLCQIANGKLLIKNDGDDISLPDRTEKVVAAWVREGEKHDIVTCGYYKIDLKGRIFGTAKPRPAFGCISAYTKKAIDFFGPPAFPAGTTDDQIWGYRTWLLQLANKSSGVLVIPDLLVKYRYQSGISTRKSKFVDWLAGVMDSYSPQKAADIDKIAPLLPPERVQQEKRFVETLRKMGNAGRTLVLSRSFKERRAALLEMAEWRKTKNFNYYLQEFLLLPRWFRDPVLNSSARIMDCWRAAKSIFAKNRSGRRRA